MCLIRQTNFLPHNPSLSGQTKFTLLAVYYLTLYHTLLTQYFFISSSYSLTASKSRNSYPVTFFYCWLQTEDCGLQLVGRTDCRLIFNELCTLIHHSFILSPDPYSLKITDQHLQQVKIEDDIEDQGGDPDKDNIEPERIHLLVTQPFNRSVQVCTAGL